MPDRISGTSRGETGDLFHSSSPHSLLFLVSVHFYLVASRRGRWEIVEIGSGAAPDGKESMLEKHGRTAVRFPDWETKHME